MAVSEWKIEFDKAQTNRSANVVCMKWGDRYGPHWVNRLYAMVKRNTSWNIRFVCFTDDASGIRPEVECQDLPDVTFDRKLGKYWPKLGLMKKDLGGLSGLTLFLDLDIVIIDSIDEFFSHPGRFCIIREWKDPHLGYGNSSIVRYVIGQEGYVLDKFYSTPGDVIVRDYDSKEQNFLSKAVEDVTFWPADWVVPFSLGCLPDNRFIRFFSVPKKPATGKVIVFYGSITPDSALKGEHQRNKRVGDGVHIRPTRRRFRPARWIGDYWCE